MAALWWKFNSGEAGTHLVRVKDAGLASQEVWLDGIHVDAPPGTMTFTGPAATLLELQQSDAGWILLVDGTVAEVYDPGMGLVETPAVAWWRFTLQGMGTHHLRVTNIGSSSQQVFLDGAPMDAPEGTMTFTGPGASLLELQKRDGVWVVVVDGVVVHQHNPNVDPTDPLHVWNFSLPATGLHQLRVAHIGRAGQEVFVDNVQLPAPEGTTTFTGPGACLLELQQHGDQWTLLVDGVAVEVGSNDDVATPGAEAHWTFLAPHTGTAHQMRVANIGRKCQEVFIDGTPVPAPEGTTMFTGPGGALLELRLRGHAWALFVDGMGVEDYNARSSTLSMAGASDAALASKRAAVDVAGSLPQGVSYDAESGSYKANIRVGGKFKCLGDFATPDEAHAQYLAAKQQMGLS
mmetsp:Transcript_121668/g.306048  ORF Transcript_121668/g.306048 Transcript_121668/m.306048 type:complete len:405 (-) Transcript_121668:84-1298(-)|eukprot:CAMPEP_0115468960 /NCGR_PEP_ID=MMETSP0271-20121206/51229_1 /TAXON_ID=71861 /ORGANISM="Scrippsiella trochoidea, Strain CCMP3099" /LENGTH=404 /DNA_ID=CAMNT_0002896035 /DNA_START=50 /DNA_END=1264 /DNA_ORIENTATION=+